MLCVQGSQAHCIRPNHWVCISFSIPWTIWPTHQAIRCPKLLISLNRILSSFSCHSQRDVLYLDVKKALDSIPHNDLLLKLWYCGICSKFWLWFKSYISSRTQCVSVQGQKSDVLPGLSDIPQGIMLGSFLSSSVSTISSLLCSPLSL